MTEDEQDQYLWDRSGPADPEVARLESLLRPLGHDSGAAPPALRLERRSWSSRAWGFGGPLVTAAAALVLGFGAWFLSGGIGGGWTVQQLAGAPRLDGVSLDGHALLRRGGQLVTDEGSRARIDIGRIGRVDVEPGTRVSLVTAGTREHRLSLDRGTIHARIWAPPRFFFVDTPSAEAIDLGCAFTLKVDEAGGGLLRVTHGWVQFAYGGREAYIPQGAVGETRPGVGPGTPRYEDAPDGYGAALEQLDFGRADPRARAAALHVVLDAARPRDALTLWHLLSRAFPPERVRVYERLAQLAPPPPRASRDAILGGDRKALDAWWNSLDIEGTSFWSRLKNRF
ncbi:MAG: FecR domain-containing protein [Acidobacteria bacterium]|nr:FecR domain-containing protein [Acidobacteriota bacterium]